MINEITFTAYGMMSYYFTDLLFPLSFSPKGGGLRIHACAWECVEHLGRWNPIAWRVVLEDRTEGISTCTREKDT
jgi:hypothetical protein